jgi:type VI secretion system secreted protein VgrG
MYQAKKVEDIAKDVVGRRSGIGPKLRFAVDSSFPPLEYCVQWQESDYDFMSRLFERHGIYYYFKHSAGDHEMVATDQKSHHQPVEGIGNPIEVMPYTQGIGRPGGAIWGWARRFEVAPHMATSSDFDFLTPAQKLKTEKTAQLVSTMDKAKVAELYVHPGGFTKATGDGRGQQISDRLVESARADSERCSAEGDAFAASVGSTIEVKSGPKASPVKYLIVATTHVYSGGKYRGGSGGEDELSVQMELIPATVQFRPLQKTPRPRIYGPQTAIVAGAQGEEIDTDKHGRIKVHFHWDRVQEGGSTSSCWIRVAQSVAGAKWGGFVLPRIGQEVVVEFLNGDPDAPLVTGAVYNGANDVPYALPANKTRSTFKSRSTPKSQGFNELRIEDKAGSEEVFFHAEKDLNSIIDKGNETRTLNSGNRTTTISSGDETLKITKGKRTETIYGDETLTIEQGKRSDTIKMGNDELAIKMGNRTTSIDMGNDELTLKMGNRTIKVNLGKHSTEAMQSIELKCGMSTFKMTPASIEMKSMTIKIEAQVMLQTKGLMVQQEASALHIIKGGLVMIN